MAEHEIDTEFFADGKEYPVDPNWVLAARMQGGIAVAIPSLATLLGFTVWLVATGGRGVGPWIALGGWLVGTVALGIWSQVGPALHYRRRSYRLDAMGLRIRRGLLFRVEISLPHSRVQHTDVSRGPIERSFGLATLVVHTAGTTNASVSLDGLPAARAYRIRDLLLEQAQGDAEGDDAV